MSTKIHLAADCRCRPVNPDPDPRPAWRLPAVHPAAGDRPHRPPRHGPAPHPARHRDGRQGVLVGGQPRLPAPPRHPGRHPGERGPEEAPPRPRPGRRAAARLRPRTLQRTQHRRAASASSGSSAPSRPATTSATSCTRPPSTSPRSGSGCEIPSLDLRDALAQYSDVRPDLAQISAHPHDGGCGRGPR